MWRSSDLPMVMLEAERLARIVAPASAPARRGRDRRPEVLADLDVEDEAGEVARLEDQVGAERDLLAGDADRLPDEAAAGANQRFS